MSKLAKAHGDQWEAYVGKECKEIEARGWGLISKNWEAPKLKGKHVNREKSKPDFSGVLPGGRHIVFECKATLEKSRFDHKALLTDHQREHLLKAHEYGALAGVYVLDGQQRKFWIPITLLRGASVNLDDFWPKERNELLIDNARRNASPKRLECDKCGAEMERYQSIPLDWVHIDFRNPEPVTHLRPAADRLRLPFKYRCRECEK